MSDRANSLPDNHRNGLPGNAYQLSGNYRYHPMPNRGHLMPD